MQLDDYVPLVGEAVIDELRMIAKKRRWPPPPPPR